MSSFLTNISIIAACIPVKLLPLINNQPHPSPFLFHYLVPTAPLTFSHYHDYTDTAPPYIALQMILWGTAQD
jgi:hypothetical protein